MRIWAQSQNDLVTYDRQQGLPTSIPSASPSTVHQGIALAHHSPVLPAPKKLAVYHRLITLSTTLADVRNALKFQHSKMRDVRVHHGPAHKTQKTIIVVSRDYS